jgi:hypothetical protein
MKAGKQEKIYFLPSGRPYVISTGFLTLWIRNYSFGRLFSDSSSGIYTYDQPVPLQIGQKS